MTHRGEPIGFAMQAGLHNVELHLEARERSNRSGCSRHRIFWQVIISIAKNRRNQGNFFFPRVSVCLGLSVSASPCVVSLTGNKRPWSHAPPPSRAFSWFSGVIAIYSKFKHSPSPQPPSGVKLQKLFFFSFWHFLQRENVRLFLTSK